MRPFNVTPSRFFDLVSISAPSPFRTFTMSFILRLALSGWAKIAWRILR